MIPEISRQAVAVTGAAHGLGAAIARAFAEKGARIVAIDRDGPALERLSQELKQVAPGQSTPEQVTILQTDLSDADETRATAERLAEIGIDTLIHNAAILRPTPFAELSFDEFRRTMDIAMTAGFILSKALWPRMNAQGGALVFVSSNSGINGFADEAHYCAAKHALEGFSKSLALEATHPELISCTITPGFPMHTPMSEANYPEELKNTWVEPARLAPAFLRIAATRPHEWTGQRLNAWELSNMEKTECQKI